ncbi:MAG: NADH-quinone oxidoreductase subunit [Chloroflexota bacterium]|jgi:NADH-quinone oxidoreductase subunit J|nr:NADH-quinone oxidoreductase subunit [Chloroflexota bacterium]
MSNALVFTLAFYVLAIATLVSGLLVVTLRNIVHAAIALIATFFFVAWLYLLLNADLLWVAQLLIYAGAIPVLIVFAVMLTRRSMSDTSNAESGNVLWAAVIAASVFGLLIAVMMPAAWHVGNYPSGLAGTTAVIGRELVNHYAVPFEVVSVLLLVGLIGAVVLARREGE